MTMKLITMSRAWALLRAKKNSKRKSKEEQGIMALLLDLLKRRITNIEGYIRLRR
jgi:hypothetical protein